ncbi:MAG: DUF1538 domain-containing protein [Firmicutes bacterium]|nr:DUF1538 domain-containing protein [Bacillota bacterium]
MNLSLVFEGFDHILLEVLTAIIPILILFLFFIFYFKMPKRMLINLLTGIAFAFAGLALFLQGVKIGFMPVGNEMGSILGGLPSRWVLIPIGFLLGFVATLAEPAVRILTRQVEKSSSGYIRSTLMMYTLCTAVGLFIALGMTRIVYGIPFYYIIIPGYLLAVILMFFSKPSFTAIAFDSGGVATGPMTVTFIMAMAVGAADAIDGRDSVTDGFGLIALVALAPIIMVMLLGFLYPNDNSENDEDKTDEIIAAEDNSNEELNSSEPDNGYDKKDLSETSPDSENDLYIDNPEISGEVFENGN